MRLSLGHIALTLFSSSMVIVLGIIILVAGKVVAIADDRLCQGSPASLDQAATLDNYTRQLER